MATRTMLGVRSSNELSAAAHTDRPLKQGKRRLSSIMRVVKMLRHRLQQSTRATCRWRLLSVDIGLTHSEYRHHRPSASVLTSFQLSPTPRTLARPQTWLSQIER